LTFEFLFANLLVDTKLEGVPKCVG